MKAPIPPKNRLVREGDIAKELIGVLVISAVIVGLSCLCGCAAHDKWVRIQQQQIDRAACEQRLDMIDRAFGEDVISTGTVKAQP